MLNKDILDGSLQQCLLALLCCDEEYGSQVGMQLTATIFDSGVRREIAKAALAYRSKYKGKPPGRKHLLMLVETLPLQETQLEAARDEAREIIRIYKKGFHKEFVVSQGIAFAKRQNFKQGIRAAADLLNKPNATVEELEQLLYKTLRYQPDTVTPGLTLADPEALNFLDKSEDGYLLGIKPFDKAGMLLAPGTLNLYMGSKNTGKSWSCIHVGRTCIRQDATVLHISLEMSRDQVIKRYYQNWFALASHDRRSRQAEIKVDNTGRATSWKMIETEAELSMKEDPAYVREKLKKKIKAWNTKLQRLMVTDFPTGSLTITQLENYLDALGTHHKFYPTVLIIDYPDLMKIDRRNYRFDLGEIYVMLRGLAIKRNIALWCPTQTNREGFEAKEVKSTTISEDISKVFTADTVITYSQTATERQFGLARLRLEHVRDGARGTEVVIAQNYNTGQYILGEPKLVTSDYMKLVTGKGNDLDDDDAGGFNL